MLLAVLVLLGSPLPALAATPLTRHDVAKYMHLSVQITRTQNEMKAHADQYDNVIQAFFKKEAQILADNGWTEKHYKAVENRIMAALDGLEQQQDLDAGAEDRAKEKADIMSNEYMSEKQKQQIIKAKEMMLQQTRQQVARSKPDWPAVKPYLKQLDQLDEWAAGNTSKLPDLPDL